MRTRRNKFARSSLGGFRRSDFVADRVRPFHLDDGKRRPISFRRVFARRDRRRTERARSGVRHRRSDFMGLACHEYFRTRIRTKRYGTNGRSRGNLVENTHRSVTRDTTIRQVVFQRARDVDSEQYCRNEEFRTETKGLNATTSKNPFRRPDVITGFAKNIRYEGRAGVEKNRLVRERKSKSRWNKRRRQRTIGSIVNENEREKGPCGKEKKRCVFEHCMFSTAGYCRARGTVSNALCLNGNPRAFGEFNANNGTKRVRCKSNTRQR